MKIAYFDCFSGISGDMILGALVDLGFDLKKELSKLKLPSCRIEIKRVKRQGIAGTKVNVISLKKEKTHKGLAQIYRIIDAGSLDKDIKQRSKDIFAKLAKAESKVHGVSVKEARFHELGNIDSVIDITGTLLGLKKLGIEKVFASKLRLGSGFVKCEHGIFPVPAPATVELVKSIPVYSDGTNSELVTPTGAALITALAEEFGDIPQMSIERVGYGAGFAELKHPNLLRVFLGECELPVAGSADFADVIEANIDDMNPEYYDFIIRKLLKEGALDVFIANIQMKKNRPGVKLSVISKPEKTQHFTDIIFRETTTFGVRVYRTKREKLLTEKRIVKTKYGNVTVKIGRLGGKIITVSPEYEDCRRLAEQKGVPLKTVYEIVLKSCKRNFSKSP
jgi:uncharacterized protein (TIGR00299 family) protein